MIELLITIYCLIGLIHAGIDYQQSSGSFEVIAEQIGTIQAVLFLVLFVLLYCFLWPLVYFIGDDNNNE